MDYSCEKGLTLQSFGRHLEYIKILELNPEEYSSLLGVNKKSDLMDINTFDICTSLLQDPTHIL